MTDVFELGAEHEQVVFCSDDASGLRAIIAHPLDRPRPRPRRHPVLPLRRQRRRAGRRPQPLPGDDLQDALAGLDLGGGKAVIIGDPATVQDRGAAARLRPVRGVAGRPLLHRLRRRHLHARTWTSSPASAASSPAAPSPTAAPATRSVLTAYGVFQGMRAAAEATWGEPTLAGRAVGVAGVGKVGRHLVAPPHRGRRRRRRHRRQRRGRRARARGAPRGAGRRLDRGAAGRAGSTSTRPARSAARSPTTWWSR